MMNVTVNRASMSLRNLPQSEKMLSEDEGREGWVIDKQNDSR